MWLRQEISSMVDDFLENLYCGQLWGRNQKVLKKKKNKFWITAINKSRLGMVWYKKKKIVDAWVGFKYLSSILVSYTLWASTDRLSFRKNVCRQQGLIFFMISSVRKEDYHSVNVENVQSKETYEDATAVKMEMEGGKILKTRDAYNRPQTLFD